MGSLFDPSKARGARPVSPTPTPSQAPPTAGDAAAPRAGALPVSRLAELIGAALRDQLPTTVRVIGEVSGFRDRTHWYFDLKDAGAVLSCVLFAQQARRQGFLPENGQEVVAEGRVDFFARQGRTQLYVDRLTPVGAGALELRFRALCDELRALGWFAPERKRPLPTFPRRIAVVTSRTGAALQDVIDTARRRCPAVELLVFDTLVQGPAAAPAIARTLRAISDRRDALRIDALLLTRGGGAMEDLWAFNERDVAHAVLQSTTPVVAAIGHETDTTIAELVADERCATPTQAAMRLIPDAAALDEQLARLRARLAQALRRTAAHERERLRGLARLPWLNDPAQTMDRARTGAARAGQQLAAALRARLADERARVAILDTRLARRRPEAQYAARRTRTALAAERLSRALRRRIDPRHYERTRDGLERAVGVAMERRADRLRALERELVLTGPASVLARGYAVATRADGALVRSPADVAPGETLTTRVRDGRIVSIVRPSDADQPTPSPAPPTPPAPLPPPRRGPPRRRRPRRGDDRHQMGLF